MDLEMQQAVANRVGLCTSQVLHASRKSLPNGRCHRPLASSFAIVTIMYVCMYSLSWYQTFRCEQLPREGSNLFLRTLTARADCDACVIHWRDSVIDLEWVGEL